MDFLSKLMQKARQSKTKSRKSRRSRSPVSKSRKSRKSRKSKSRKSSRSGKAIKAFKPFNDAKRKASAEGKTTFPYNGNTYRFTGKSIGKNKIVKRVR
jgi:hypothetical protein